MILTLIPAAVIIVGALILKFRGRFTDGLEILGTSAVSLGALWLLICLGAIAYAPIEGGAIVAQYESLQTTLDTARANPQINPLELAAIQQKVAAFNQGLAKDQYYAQIPLTSWFWSRRILPLKPIR